MPEFHRQMSYAVVERVGPQGYSQYQARIGENVIRTNDVAAIMRAMPKLAS